MKTAKTGAFLATAVGLMFMANVAQRRGGGRRKRFERSDGQGQVHVSQ